MAHGAAADPSPTHGKRWIMKFILRNRTLIVTLALLCAIAIPVIVSAHPMGDFAISRYSRIALADNAVNVTYIVDLAEVPTFQTRDVAMDTDDNGTVSDAEAQAWLEARVPELVSNLALTVDGDVVPLDVRASSIEFPPGDGGLLTTRIVLELSGTLAASDAAWSVEYNDANYAGRVGWQEIVIEAGDDVVLLSSTAPTEDLSQGLLEYPEGPILENSSASLTFEPLGLSDATESITVPALRGAGDGEFSSLESAETDRQFANLIDTQLDNPRVVVVVFFTALIAGAAHALSPGHGKTIVAAYLVGSRGTPAHAIFLGLTTTITHTLGVFGVGLITLFASEYIVPEVLFPWIGVFSGLLVIGIGWSLFRNRLSTAVNPDVEIVDDHDHADVEFKDGTFVHAHGGGRAHSHMPPTTAGGISWGSLFALGVSGGLLPCPAALVLMLGAISIGRVPFGLVLILVFSIGLASVLTAIGLLWVKARDLVERYSGENSIETRWPLVGRALQWGPAFSAGFITLAGVFITISALRETGVL